MQYKKNILSEGLTTLKSKYMICGIWLLYDKMADYYFTNTQIIRLNLIEYFDRMNDQLYQSNHLAKRLE